jgi:acetyl-CoA C-acetyltransferase
MPETGDNVAKDLGITREQSDEFALASQQKYATAEKEGFYAGEIMPVTLPAKKKDAPGEQVKADEHPRRDSTMEALAKLKPLFEGGVVTAGNASGVNDGAAALVIGSRRWGEKKSRKPLARIRAAASAGVEPRIMGVGPAYAIPRALERAGLKLSDMDIIEINEAFASQVLGCLKLMNVDLNDPRVNPNGGAIAIGHPLGASGARLALTVAREMQQSGARYAAVSLCIGVGQGLAVILERVQ